MERNNTPLVKIGLGIVMMSMLCISCVAEQELVAKGQCISNCVSLCHGSPNYIRCYDECTRRCVPAFATATSSHSFYCNLGCSLHKCADVAYDAKKLESCLDVCSNVQCKA